jgi:hypothetical protein
MPPASRLLISLALRLKTASEVAWPAFLTEAGPRSPKALPEQRNWANEYRHLVRWQTGNWRPKFRQPHQLLGPAYGLVRDPAWHGFCGHKNLHVLL